MNDDTYEKHFLIQYNKVFHADIKKDLQRLIIIEINTGDISIRAQ